jgi:hypothetical protein
MKKLWRRQPASRGREKVGDHMKYVDNMMHGTSYVDKDFVICMKQWSGQSLRRGDHMKYVGNMMFGTSYFVHEIGFSDTRRWDTCGIHDMKYGHNMMQGTSYVDNGFFDRYEAMEWAVFKKR